MNTRFTVARLAFAVVAFAFAGAAYWVSLERSFVHAREAALADGRLRARQITEALRQDLTATFRGADFLLRNIRDVITQAPNAPAGTFRTLGGHVLSLLPAAAEAGFSAYDAEGRLLAALPEGGRPVPESIAHLDWFQDAKACGPIDALGIAAAERRPDGHGWVIPLTRPLVRNGTFDGILVLWLSPHYLSDELSRIVLGRNDALGAVHVPDGTYLARSSRDEQLVGTKVPPERPYLAKDAPASGTFDIITPHDQVKRLYGWARLEDLPVVTFVGLSVEDLMAPIERQVAAHRIDNAIGTAIIVALAAAIFLLAARDLTQQRALIANAERYRALFEQNHSVKLVSDPHDGRILEANAAASAFYGYSRAQLMAMNIADINCLPRDEIRRAMEEARKARRPSFVFPHRLASGAIRMVEVYSGPVEVHGKTALYSIIHDVTDRFELERALRESEERYRTIFEAVPAGMLVIDRHGNVVAWNDAALRLLHTDAAGVVNRSKTVFGPHGEMLEHARRPSTRCLTEDISGEVSYVLDRKGQRCWFAVHSRRLHPGQDGPRGAVLTFSDITRAVQLEESLLVSQRVFDATAEGIVVTDPLGRIINVNPAFERITGYTAAEAIGRRPKLLSSGIHDAAFYRAMFDSLATKKSWEGEITNRRKDGTLFVERAVISAIERADGVLFGYVMLLSDVTERRHQEEELWHRANFDQLTGLPNRTLLADRIGQALGQSRRHGLMVGLLFADLDCFKPVNDRWGHAAGDELLKQVAERLCATVRSEDTVARLGGDEFVVLLPGIASADDAVTVARKLLDRLREPFHISPGVASVSACIGVAMSADGAMEAGELLRRADAAMYQGKVAGRSRVTLYKPAGA